MIEYGELERAAASRCRLTSGWCVTNADLPRMVEEGWLPPTCSTVRLRRGSSVRCANGAERDPLLANQFAIQMCRELGLPLFPGLTPPPRSRWPGIS